MPIFKIYSDVKWTILIGSTDRKYYNVNSSVTKFHHYPIVSTEPEIWTLDRSNLEWLGTLNIRQTMFNYLITIKYNFKTYCPTYRSTVKAWSFIFGPSWLKITSKKPHTFIPSWEPCNFNLLSSESWKSIDTTTLFDSTPSKNTSSRNRLIKACNNGRSESLSARPRKGKKLEGGKWGMTIGTWKVEIKVYINELEEFCFTSIRKHKSPLLFVRYN